MSSEVPGAHTLQKIVHDVVERFYLRATLEDGRVLKVPVGYQANEPGFRPYRGGKASPEELQQQLDDLLAIGSPLGIVDEVSLSKLAIQMGWGVDCSAFVYRVNAAIYEQLGLGEYSNDVYRNNSEVMNLIKSKPSWKPKDEYDRRRELTDEERNSILATEKVSVRMICDLLGKEPEFLIAAKHIADASDTVSIGIDQVIPGDFIAFRKGQDEVRHVASVSYAGTRDGKTHLRFWHVAHTRDFQSGLRHDHAVIGVDGTCESSFSVLEREHVALSFHRTLAVEKFMQEMRAKETVIKGDVISRSDKSGLAPVAASDTVKTSTPIDLF